MLSIQVNPDFKDEPVETKGEVSPHATPQGHQCSEGLQCSAAVLCEGRNKGSSKQACSELVV